MPFGERVLFSGAMAGGASVSAASSEDNSVSTTLSSGFAAPAAPSRAAADCGSLPADGSGVIVEPKAGDRVEENLNPVGRAYYAFSTLLCTPASLSQPV